jgi:site-specific DNA recombinase
MYAARMGITRIAKTLNAEGVPPPRGGLGWAPSAIREILHRPLYRGEIVWNEYQKVERGGTKQRQRRKQEQLIKVDAPELRILSEEMWQQVQQRLQAKQAIYSKSSGQEGNRNSLRGPALRDIESPYLLSGMARCGHCGGPDRSPGSRLQQEEGPLLRVRLSSETRYGHLSKFSQGGAGHAGPGCPQGSQRGP